MLAAFWGWNLDFPLKTVSVGLGQSAIIKTTFKQKVIDFMKKLYPNYADWMITISYRVE